MFQGEPLVAKEIIAAAKSTLESLHLNLLQMGIEQTSQEGVWPQPTCESRVMNVFLIYQNSSNTYYSFYMSSLGWY